MKRVELLMPDENGDSVLMFHCPGCNSAHGPRVLRQKVDSRPFWTWDGDYENPTLTPSVVVKIERRDGQPPFVCHSIITDGKISFLHDSSHALAGQTVPLPEWE